MQSSRVNWTYSHYLEKKYNKFIHVRLIWDLLFGKAKRTFSHLYFSSQLCWKCRFGNFDFGSHDLSFSGSASSFAVDVSAVSFLCCCPKNAESLLFLTSLCVNAHQERGSQLSTWIYMIHPPIALIQTSAREHRKIQPSMYVILWILVLALLLILWNLNQNIVLRRFCTWGNYISFFIFFQKSQNDPEQVFDGDIFAQTMAILQCCSLDQTLLNKTFII